MGDIEPPLFHTIIPLYLPLYHMLTNFLPSFPLPLSLSPPHYPYISPPHYCTPSTISSFSRHNIKACPRLLFFNFFLNNIPSHLKCFSRWEHGKINNNIGNHMVMNGCFILEDIPISSIPYSRID